MPMVRPRCAAIYRGQHEHIHVKLVGRTRGALTLSASNLGDAAGSAQIFIGCSREPFTVAGTGPSFLIITDQRRVSLDTTACSPVERKMLSTGTPVVLITRSP